MLFQKTNNKYIINTFNILVEVLIGFSIFALFFGIFMIYFMTTYEVELLKNFINQSIAYYKSNNNQQSQLLLKQFIDNSPDMKTLKQSVYLNEQEVNSHNAPYDNKLLIIIISMITGILFIILIPLILGIIRLEQINFKYIGISTTLHIILIVGLELLFLLIILRYINPVKLYNLFQSNKNNTGNYFIAA